MTIIDRYVLKAVLSHTASVLFVLLSLAGFVHLISQLGDIGTGRYQLGTAIAYVAMRLPQSAFEMMPMAVLIGGLLGLGGLATHSELIVLRAAGLSVWRLAVSVGIAGLILTLFTAVLGELIAAPVDQYARHYRMMRKSESLSLAGSTWVRDGDLIMNVERYPGALSYGGLYLYRFGPDRKLQSLGRADAARFDREGQWQLGNYRETSFTDDGVTTRFERIARQPTRIDADVLNLAVVRPETMTIQSLSEYRRYLRSNDLDSELIDLALWSRSASIASVFFMTLLSLPFVFGSLRTSGTGSRMVIGVTIGLGYYLLNRTLANTGQVFDLNPILVTWAPAALVATATAIGLVRVR